LVHNFNKYEYTVDREAADAAAPVTGRHCVCTHQAAALFGVNDVMAAILKLSRQIRTALIDAYLLGEQYPAKIHPDPI